MSKFFTLLLVAAVMNAVIGNLWRRLIFVVHYSIPLAFAGFVVCLFGVALAVHGRHPIAFEGGLRKAWPLALFLLCAPIFYVADMQLLKRMPFSRVYPLVACGTIFAALIIDTIVGEESLTLRKVIGVCLAGLAIWFVRDV